jgi:hypothetical protein
MRLDMQGKRREDQLGKRQEDQLDKRQDDKKDKNRNRNRKSDGKQASEYKLVFGNICSKFVILNFLFGEKVSLPEDIENK